MPTEDTTESRPRLGPTPTDILDGLVDELSEEIRMSNVDNSRFFGKRREVTKEAVIREGLRELRSKKNNGELEL